MAGEAFRPAIEGRLDRRPMLASYLAGGTRLRDAEGVSQYRRFPFRDLCAVPRSQRLGSQAKPARSLSIDESNSRTLANTAFVLALTR
jgi:hypothetical protein